MERKSTSLGRTKIAGKIGLAQSQKTEGEENPISQSGDVRGLTLGCNSRILVSLKVVIT